MQQSIEIPIGNWPCSILENFFIYLYEYILPLIYSDKVNAGHFHSTKRFTDELCLIKDGGKFGRSFPQIYPSELELKIKTTMLLFFNLEITIKEGRFTYNVFDKKDTFSFSICEHLTENILQNIFYSVYCFDNTVDMILSVTINIFLTFTIYTIYFLLDSLYYLFSKNLASKTEVTVAKVQ